jgi:hypothetical protein
MNLAINQFLKLFGLSIFCTALLFSAPVLSLDTDGDGSDNAQDAGDDDSAVTLNELVLDAFLIKNCEEYI